MVRALAPLVLLLLPQAAAGQLSAREVADRAPRSWAITGGMVHVGDGTVLDGATVVFRDGLIVAVGEGAATSAGGAVFDAAGKHVYPGFTLALTDLGLGADASRDGEGDARPPPSRGPEDRPATFSWRRAADGLSLDDERIAASRDAGFTSAVSVHGDGIVSGKAAFLSLAGTDPRDLVVGGDQAVMVRLETLGFRSFPGSVMGVIAYVRQVFLDAAHYGEVWRIYEGDPTGLARPRHDRALAPLVAAAGGGQPVLLPANLDKEIRRMTALASELGLAPILYGGHEAASAAAFLADAGVPILVDLNWPTADPDADPEVQVPLRELRLRDQAPAGPAALAGAGVRFAFYESEASESDGPLDAVREAVRRGLDPEAALTALTAAPAEIFGVSDRVGTLSAGKIANLVVTDRSVFDDDARIEAVFVDGLIHRPEAPGDDTTNGGEKGRGENR